MIPRLGEPVRILFLAANPSRTADLRLSKEANKIKKTLPRIAFDFRYVGGVTDEVFSSEILEFRPQFVHFSGHGDGEAGILLEDDDEHIHLVTAEALEDLFRVFKREVRCVFLNCCYSQPQADAIARHIPYVIGTRDALSNPAAVRFSIAFYEAIGQDMEVPDAFDFAIAALKLRNLAHEAQIPFLHSQVKLPTAVPLLEPPQEVSLQGSDAGVSRILGEDERTALRNWALEESCRVILLIVPESLASLRRTTTISRSSSLPDLAPKLIRELALERCFERIGWESLVSSSSVFDTVSHLLDSLNTRQLELVESQAEVNELLRFLKKHRCLLVLEGIESLLETSRDCFRPDREGDRDVICKLGENQHKSCLLIISRRPIAEVEAQVRGGDGSVRLMDLRSSLSASKVAIFQPQETRQDSAQIDSILDLLQKRVQYFPPSLRSIGPAKNFHLFEIIATYIISLIEASFQWTVTPIQGDEGVDFYGEKTLFHVPGLDGDVRMVIAGQCKIGRDHIDSLSTDLFSLLEVAKPSLVILALAAPVAKESIIRSQRLFSEATRRQCYILGLSQFHCLINIYYRELLPILRHALTRREQADFASFFQKSDPDDFVAEVQKVDHVLAGVPFVVKVSLQTGLLLKGPGRARWKPQSDLLLVKPVELASDTGIELIPDDGFSASFSIKLISYFVGKTALGYVTFDLQEGATCSVDLGQVTAADQYHPAFFWEPFRHHRVRFLELLDQVCANLPTGIAVVGQGGAGKTRLSQELGYLAEQGGGEFITLSHPQNLEEPYRVFALLTQELLPSNLSLLDPRESLESYLQSINPNLYQRARPTIAVAFSEEATSREVFNRETMIQVLLVLLLLRARTRLQVVHLCDLHWASHEALEILGELLLRLKKLAESQPSSILFVFEGRVQTQLSTQTGGRDRATVSTAVFESFIGRYHLERVTVQPLTIEQSDDLLCFLFETSQSSHRRIPKALIPHQNTLITEIARYGQGNPFHLIEQIKLLRHQEIVARNPRTGLIFLCGRPRSSYPVPSSIHDLITLRFTFVQENFPQLALLIKAVGLIKDRIDGDLFWELKRTLAESLSDSVIEQIEMLTLGERAEIRFRHENYYEVIHRLPLTQEERQRITAVYLFWYERLETKSVQRLYEEAIVRLACTEVNLQQVEKVLGEALERAESTSQYQLAVQILRRLLSDFRFDESRFLVRIGYQEKLADILHKVESWRSGAEEYEKVISDIDIYSRSNPRLASQLRLKLLYVRTLCTLQLANCNTDLALSHVSISLLETALQICNSAFLLPAKDQLPQWNILYVRILNRLGEAHWMDGNYERALNYQEQAMIAIDSKRLPPGERTRRKHINLLDYGAVLLHRDPEEAVATLKRGLKLSRSKGWSPRYAILASTTLALGEMVNLFLKEAGNSVAFQVYLRQQTIPQLEKDFEQAQFFGFKQEQAASSLMLAISLSLLGDAAAVHWYMEAIETSFHSNNLEALWRGHLNLAQDLSTLKDTESSVFHAERAQQLLLNDLQRRTPEQRKWKLRHLRYPLLRSVALFEAAGQKIAPGTLELLADLPPDFPDFRRPSRDFFQDKLVFLWDHGSQYYFYGG